MQKGLRGYKKIFCFLTICCCFLWACASEHPSEPVPAATHPAKSGSGTDATSQGLPSPATPKPPPGEVVEENLASGPKESNGVVSPVMIRQVQVWLNTLRYKAGTPDGKMSAQTVQAVKAYQKSRGMTVDGKITEVLREGLYREIQKK